MGNGLERFLSHVVTSMFKMFWVFQQKIVNIWEDSLVQNISKQNCQDSVLCLVVYAAMAPNRQMIDLFQESGSHNCGGWAGRSKTCQADSTRLEAQTGVDTAVLRQNFFFSKKSQVLLLRPSTDWIRPTQPMKDNLLHLKSADCKPHHIDASLVYTIS